MSKAPRKDSADLLVDRVVERLHASGALQGPHDAPQPLDVPKPSKDTGKRSRGPATQLEHNLMGRLRSFVVVLAIVCGFGSCWAGGCVAMYSLGRSVAQSETVQP